MQALMILALIIAVITFLMPFIFSVLIFFIGAILILLLLARFGLLPGAMFKMYGAKIDDRSPNSHKKRRHFNFEEEEREWKERRGGWYGSQQDGEEITLPESALHKEDKPEKDRH
ncbi:MAG: hypothetical protein LBT23_11970 [Synergistaceae bacterium]|jgi:hypothetical protein|nr:hypothetical protein [Synergistaceae bacterium]